MRILLYGCGDFSNVIESLSFIKQQLGYAAFQPVDAAHADPSDDVLATELRSENELRKVYGDVVATNVQALGSAGVAVGFEMDATGHYSVGQFDLIVFRNPHTGTYGNGQDPGMSSYLVSSTDNQRLLMAALANSRKILNPNGQVLITAVGWPYIGKNPKGDLRLTGMQLEVPSFAAEYGTKAGLVHVRNIDLGQMWVARNRGSTFVADELGILYRN
ncbi:Rossmann-like fold-containing protein [Nocardia sp. NPDC088792]|uniref:Rossmann-like fold-containing protein n=1 Tax=Nocardia sp. NPDC088792 TaxID=3364332 RepID=UPI0037FC48FB